MKNVEIKPFPSVSEESIKIEKEIEQLKSRLEELRSKEIDAILIWAKDTYEGKIINFGYKNNITKIRKVVSIGRNSINGNYTMRTTGEVLENAYDMNGFKSIKERRIYKSITLESRKYDTYRLKPDGTIAQIGHRFIEADEWRNEVKKSEQLNKWLKDQHRKEIRLYHPCIYIKDGKLKTGIIEDFDPTNGLFKIHYGYEQVNNMNGDPLYDYRLGSEIIVKEKM